MGVLHIETHFNTCHTFLFLGAQVVIPIEVMIHLTLLALAIADFMIEFMT